jgi:hypothetical protein
MATSDNKQSQFAFTLSSDEHQMLSDLSAREHASKANLVRAWIRAKYSEAYPGKLPGAPVPATLRAIVAELAGPSEHTAKGLAERTGVPVARLNETLGFVGTKTHTKTDEIVFRPTGGRGAHAGPNTVWDLAMPREDALDAIEQAGFDVDQLIITEGDR